MLLNHLLNAVIQVLLFSIPPWIWWLVTARKKTSFFKWLGLKKPQCTRKRDILIPVFIILAGCFFLGELAIWLRGNVTAADSAYKGMGLAALPSVLIYSYIQTALSEEILFRGFLLKRLMAKFGFLPATAIQALLFGALHLIMVWGQVGVLAGLVIVIYPIIPAVAFSYVNERKADGSIFPGWFIHGTLNTISTLLVLL